MKDECDELMSEWLQSVKSVVDQEDLFLNVGREKPQHHETLRGIKKNLVVKCLGLSAEISEKR